MTFRLIAILTFAACISACSTVNRGTQDFLRIDTVPQGAKVTTTEKDVLRKLKNYNKKSRKVGIKTRICEATPCAIPVPRRTTLVARVELDNYEPVEFFVTSSTQKGAAAGSVALNSGASAGTGALIGAWAAGFGNALSFGITNYSSSALAAGSATIGLGVGAGFIAVDAGTGANLNLYPNPVVIGLAPEGTETLKDPMAPLFLDKLNAEIAVSKYCVNVSRKNKVAYKSQCSQARQKEKKAKSDFNDTKRKIEAARKTAVKAARQAAKSN